MRQFAQSRHKHTWPHGCIIISTFSIKHTLQPPVSRDGLSLSIVLFCRLSSSLSCSFSSLLSFAVWNQNKAASVANNNQKSSNNLKVIILYMITYLYTLYDVIISNDKYNLCIDVPSECGSEVTLIGFFCSIYDIFPNCSRSICHDLFA